MKLAMNISRITRVHHLSFITRHHPFCNESKRAGSSCVPHGSKIRSICPKEKPNWWWWVGVTHVLPSRRNNKERRHEAGRHVERQSTTEL